MYESGNSGARSRKRFPVASFAAALLGAAVLCQPDFAHAAHGAGGGFHGGGFHGGGFGGFHSGGFRGGGGFHGNPFHGGGFHGGVVGLHDGFRGGQSGHWYHGWQNGRYGWWWGDGLGWSYYPYGYGWDNNPDYGYYGYSQPYAGQIWYYCSDPAGYYPYVTQCNTGWQTVPAS